MKVNQAIDTNLHLVSIDWLLKSVDAGGKEPEADYALDATAVGSQPSGTKRAAKDDVEEEDPASKKAKAVDGTARPKRGKVTAPVPADGPPAATTRPRGEKSATPAPALKEEDDGDEDKKKVAVGKARPKKAVNPPTPVKEEEGEEEQPVPKKIPVKGKGKGKAKAKAEKEEEEEEVVVMKTVVKKGKAPVDELSGLANSHHVYVDGSGTAWDATLNQTNVRNHLYRSK